MANFKKKILDSRRFLVLPQGSCLGYRGVNTGNVALKAIQSGYISSEALEAARKAIRKGVKKTGRIIIRTAAFLPITKKPSEVRMGKGKGKIKGYVSPVTKGKVLFEIKNVIVPPH